MKILVVSGEHYGADYAALSFENKHKDTSISEIIENLDNYQDEDEEYYLEVKKFGEIDLEFVKYLRSKLIELSLFDFKSKLIYKAIWYNRDIIEVDRYFASSKLCNCCGYKNTELNLKDREWKCNNCGVSHNRDLNAAINIEKQGRKILNNKIPTRCGELTPLETSGYAVDELGNRDLDNIV